MPWSQFLFLGLEVFVFWLALLLQYADAQMPLLVMNHSVSVNPYI